MITFLLYLVVEMNTCDVLGSETVANYEMAIFCFLL